MPLIVSLVVEGKDLAAPLLLRAALLLHDGFGEQHDVVVVAYLVIISVIVVTLSSARMILKFYTTGLGCLTREW